MSEIMSNVAIIGLFLMLVQTANIKGYSWRDYLNRLKE